MISKNIFLQFIVWFLWDTPKKILLAWGNFLRFNLEFFSIFLLFKTLFAPWRQYRWEYGKGFNFGTYFRVLFSNVISRGLGMIIRSALIFAGLNVEALIFMLGLLIFLGWFALPILLWNGLITGLRFLFLAYI